MALAQEDKQHVKHIAEDSLDLFEKVADAARGALRAAPVHGSDVLADLNSWKSGEALQKYSQIDYAKRESYQKLSHEPAIARIVVLDRDGRQRIYYICRVTPLTGFSNLASYRAPVGRLASLPLGTELRLPNGDVVEVVERARLRPHELPDGWDSRDNIVEAHNFGPVTIESFKSFLEEVARAPSAEDLLKTILAEEELKANIIEGVRRSVITKMGLRDQPILDQYQDEIFRLPLNKRLLILGPPGTGKTTTLIRRLGQKLDVAFLDEEEQRIVKGDGLTNGIAHSNSWLMFTPTELLKQYVKEAFAREGVPASDQRIRTWLDYRRELARNTFGVLRTANGGGVFVLKETVQSVANESIVSPIKWFTDFDDWQRVTFVKDLRQSSQLLRASRMVGVPELGDRLATILDDAASNSLYSTFEALAAEVGTVQALVAGLKDATDLKIRVALNQQLNRDRGFLDELARFIDGLHQTEDAEVDDQDDLESDEEEALLPRTGRAEAMKAYMKAVRAHARAFAAKRTVNKNSRNGLVVEWLGERMLGESDRAEVGASLLVQASARRFVNPVKRYITGIPKRYRVFRRLRQEVNKWYIKDTFASTDIHPLELDIVILAILRGAGDLLSRSNIVRNIDTLVWSSLKPVLDLYRNQILVDEATDFSPVQLASMAALSQPHIRSFFACGDFNQRLTTWGSRTPEDLKWVFPDLDIKEITVSYRHSRQLNELARAIIYAAGGAEQRISLPEHVDSEGVAPALLESASELPQIVNWLSNRIREIERFVGQLPSTAIFVNSESEVGPVADALNNVLAENNIQVVACPQGQVMGHDNDVRVFDIQHIKGLEFEAVFFIAIDRLATIHPELFDKYLYVGTTRAATYLGVTCEQMLPSTVSTLRPMFVSDWQVS